MKHLSRNSEELEKGSIKITIEVSEEDLNRFFAMRPMCRGRIYEITKVPEWNDILDEEYYEHLRRSAKDTSIEKLLTSKEKTTEGLMFGWKKLVFQKSIEKLAKGGFALDDREVLKIMSDNPFSEFFENEINSYANTIVAEKKGLIKKLSEI